MTGKDDIKNEPIEPINRKEPVDKIHLSHDGLFRIFFDEKEVAESFIKEYLPAEIIKDLDFNTLTIFKETFVDKNFIRSYSDILYYIHFQGNPAYIYFLFEHKSWEREFPGLQLLKYMVGIWETHLNQHKDTKHLPPIIPLLIYHGENKWEVGTNFISMFDIPRSLEKYIPAFNFELFDISHMPDDELRGNIELQILLTTFKYIFNPELRYKLKDIFQLLLELKDKNKGSEYLETLLRYFSYNAENIKIEQFRESMTQLLEKGGAIMATLAQQWLAEGKEIGLKEGKEIGQHEGEEKNKLKVAINCLVKGIDIDTIAEITELPVERIKLLKASMQK